MPPTAHKARGRDSNTAMISSVATTVTGGIAKRGPGRPRKITSTNKSSVMSTTVSPSSSKNTNPQPTTTNSFGDIMANTIRNIAKEEAKKAMKSHAMREIINNEITLAFIKYENEQKQNNNNDETEEEFDDEDGEEANNISVNDDEEEEDDDDE